MSAEILLVDWLNKSALVDAGFSASLDVPSERPERFITVERVGGSESFVTGSPLFAVQVWAKYRFEASDFANALGKELRKIVLEPWVANVTVSSVHNFPDTAGRHARYQLSVELVTRFDY